MAIIEASANLQPVKKHIIELVEDLDKKDEIKLKQLKLDDKWFHPEDKDLEHK